MSVGKTIVIFIVIAIVAYVVYGFAMGYKIAKTLSGAESDLATWANAPAELERQKAEQRRQFYEAEKAKLIEWKVYGRDFYEGPIHVYKNVLRGWVGTATIPAGQEEIAVQSAMVAQRLNQSLIEWDICAYIAYQYAIARGGGLPNGKRLTEEQAGTMVDALIRQYLKESATNAKINEIVRAVMNVIASFTPVGSVAFTAVDTLAGTIRQASSGDSKGAQSIFFWGWINSSIAFLTKQGAGAMDTGKWSWK